MPQEIYILDLLGTFAFATYGSYFALKKKFDIFGIFICALLTAVGGGTLREFVLNNIPFYFYDMNYILVILMGAIFTILIYKKFQQINPLVHFLDSVGLVTFAFIGASKGNDLNLGIFGITFLATITAIGGGLLRDILLNQIPEIMYRNFYASIAILFGIIYGVFHESMSSVFWSNSLICICLIIRLLTSYYSINLWKPGECSNFNF